MRARQAMVAALPALAALFATAGCGGGSDAGAPAPSPSAAERTVSQTAYLITLERVDAGLVADEDRAIATGKESCADIESGLTGDRLHERIAQRLSITTDQASTVAGLLRQYMC